MRLTFRHHYRFRDGFTARALDSPAAWDALREGDDIFALPTDRGEWEAVAARVNLDDRARTIARVAAEVGARSVASYGVGPGFLEWSLRRVAPELDLVCTDYAPQTVERLAAHLDVPVMRHDLRHDPPLDVDLHLLYRVDTELSDAEWPTVLARFDAPVLVGATEIAGLRAIGRELATRMLRRDAKPAGWIRTESAFRALWSESHDDAPVDLDGLRGYLLTPRRAEQTASTSSSRSSG